MRDFKEAMFWVDQKAQENDPWMIVAAGLHASEISRLRKEWPEHSFRGEEAYMDTSNARRWTRVYARRGAE